DYPAWQFLEKSHLRDILIKEYEELYKKTPEVTTVHAGLECGLFIGKRPDLDCVSIGPDMGQVHSFNEHLSIESTKRTYDYLLAILKNM
ncbi:MAG TPA: M20/M25/M40 family metallo-hydrolase, partial [Candidatus Dorea intestinavium]|nr:M20/M25/M40 family metallo-hydrolase [Candidatus Dorea intestinavium]